MARARETFGKKENQTRKDKKRKEKEQKRIDRKENKGSGSLDDMIAYVDEFGNITSTPPDLSNRTSVKAEDIELGAARLTDPDPAELIHTGTVTFFDTGKGFGFIKDSATKQGVFVHMNGLLEPISENNQVTFEVVKGPKGLSAVNVKLKRE